MSVVVAGDMLPNIAPHVNILRKYLWMTSWALLGLWSAYNLGVVSSEKPLFRSQTAAVSQAAPQEQGTASSKASDPRVVVSRSKGSSKYHYSWCPGAKRILEANKVWYPTAADAEAAGYRRAENCTPH
jgi:hypothetical protein